MASLSEQIELIAHFTAFQSAKKKSSLCKFLDEFLSPFSCRQKCQSVMPVKVDRLLQILGLLFASYCVLKVSIKAVMDDGKTDQFEHGHIFRHKVSHYVFLSTKIHLG